MYRVYIEKETGSRQSAICHNYHFEQHASTVKHAWHLAEIMVEQWRSRTGGTASMMTGIKRDLSLSKLTEGDGVRLIGYASSHKSGDVRLLVHVVPDALYG